MMVISEIDYIISSNVNGLLFFTSIDIVLIFFHYLIGYPQHLLYRSLGECLVKESPPKEDCQAILQIIWKYISELKDPTKFMHCIEIWIQFTVMHFSVSYKILFKM